MSTAAGQEGTATGSGEAGAGTSGTGPATSDGGSGEGVKQEDKTFTQADVDRIVQDRLAREKGKYSDYDELKSKAEEFQKLQDAQKTEAQKAADDAAAAAKKAEEAQAELKHERIRSAVYAKAAEEGINAKAAHRLIDQSAINVGDDGLPTEDSLKTAFEQMFKDFPELKAATKPRGSADGGAGKGGTPDGASGMNDWIRQQATR